MRRKLINSPNSKKKETRIKWALGRTIQLWTSSASKSELFAHFRERSAQMEPIHHPYSGGQLCWLPVPFPTLEEGALQGRVPWQCVLRPEGGAVADRRRPSHPARPPRCHRRLGAACHTCSHSDRVLVTAGSVSRGRTTGPWRWLRRKRACSWKCGDGCRARS